MPEAYILYYTKSYPLRTVYHGLGSQCWCAKLLGQANLREKWKPKDGVNPAKLGGSEEQPPGRSAEYDLNQVTGPHGSAT